MLALLVAQVALASPPSPARIAALAEPASAVVLLRQGSSTCAGAFVSEQGQVVTAYHCVADGGPVTVETRDGRRARGRVTARLPSHDLAIVDVAALAGEPWLAVRGDAIPVGSRIFAWGHPNGATPPGGFLAGTLRWSVTEGTVAASGPRALQITAAVNPGNSGGPVVDEQGALVGVVSRRLRGEALGFAARGEVVSQLLAEPSRGPLLGGSVRAEVGGSSFEGDGGAVSLGGRVEVAIRDRVVASVGVGRALQPVLDALRFGASSWIGTELTAGLRQRLGAGYLTTRLDAYGGAGFVARVETIGDRASFRTGLAPSIAPMLGGRVGIATVTLDVAAVFVAPTPALRTTLALRWPGRIGVF